MSNTQIQFLKNTRVFSMSLLTPTTAKSHSTANEKKSTQYLGLAIGHLKINIFPCSVNLKEIQKQTKPKHNKTIFSLEYIFIVKLILV